MPPKDHLFDFQSEVEVPVGPSGLAPELLKEVLLKRLQIVTKMITGNCKSLESYADAVGYVRGLDFVLTFAQRQKDTLEREQGVAITNDED